MTHHVSTTQHYNQHIVFTNYLVWAQLTRGIKEWLTHIFVIIYCTLYLLSVMIVVLNVLKKSPWAFLLLSFYSLKTLVKMPKRSPFEEYLWCLSAISWWLPIGEDVFLTLSSSRKLRKCFYSYFYSRSRNTLRRRMNTVPRSIHPYSCVSAGSFPDFCSVVQTVEGKESRPGSHCVELHSKPRDSQGTEHLCPPLFYFTTKIFWGHEIQSAVCLSAELTSIISNHHLWRFLRHHSRNHIVNTKIILTINTRLVL